ncbi:MAG: Ig-like domain-containing protein [Microcoleaceae cyanobacterium]
MSSSLSSMHHVKFESFTNTHTPKHYISPIFDYPQNLVVIDSKVDHLQHLITGVVPHSIIVVLDHQQDSIQQLTEAIKKYKYCTTLHLVSHGYPGGITVGNSKLNLETLHQYSSSIQQWNLNTILLYGCEVAAGDAGTEFIEKLHHLSGSNIAASTTKTGHNQLDGNWKLEVTKGQFEVNLAFNQATQKQWNSVLNDTLPDQPYFFQVIDGTLKLLNPLTGDYVDIGTPKDIYNGTGFNTNDNYIYGLGRDNNIADGVNIIDKVIRVRADGSVEDLGIPTVETNKTNNSLAPIFAGDVDDNNNLWLRQGSNLIKVDINNKTTTEINFTNNSDAGKVADLIWVDSGGQGSLYGVHNGDLYIWNIDKQTIKKEAIDESSLDTATELPDGSYGAAWIDAEGDLYVSHNGDADKNIKGKLYRIDDFTESNRKAVYITDTEATDRNDGMSDPEQKSPFIVPFIDLDGSGGDNFDVFNYETTFTENGGGINIVAPDNVDESLDVLIRDFDQDINNQLIDTVTITLTNKQENDELLADGLPDGITANVTETDGEITVTLTTTAGASPEDIELALEAITFNNTSDTPDKTPRTVEIFLTDPDGNNGNITTTTINIDPVNDAPSFASLDNTPSYTISGSAVILDSNATISDPELDADNNYDGATLTLARNGGVNTEDVFGISSGSLTEGGNLTVNGTDIGTVTTNSNGTLVLTFNGNATADLVDQALQEITYSNTGTTTGSVTIDYTINDGNTGDDTNPGEQGLGGALTGTGSIIVNLTNNNIPSSIDNSITTDEDNSHTFISSDFPFTDSDAGESLQSVKITALPTNGKLLLDGVEITAANTEITLADITAGKLQFEPNSNENGDNYANFTFQVSDGEDYSSDSTLTINVTPVNDPPSFASLDNTPNYPLGGSAVILDSDATISDLELDADNNYDGATLTLARNGGANAEDVFNNSSGTLTEGGDLTVNGNVIATVTTNSNGTLVLTFNSNATADLVDQALQEITYSNTGTTTGSVTIDYTINDGNTGAQGTGGALTGTGSIAINLTNTDPVANDNEITVNEGSEDTNLGLTSPTDADGDDLTITITELPNLGTITKADGTPISVGDTLTETELTELIYDAPDDYNGTDDPGDFSYEVTDGNGGIDTGTVDITINTVNNPPVAVDDNIGTTKDATVTIDVLADNSNGEDSDPDNDELTVTQINGTDINPGDTITLPSGALLTFNTDGTFSYDPNDQFNSLTGTTTDTDSFTYTIFDGTETSEATVTVTIAGENSPPVAENDTVSTDANTVLTGNVLTDNGNGEDSDPDGNDITVNQINGETVNIGQPIVLESGAEITLNPDGTFSYNPNDQYTSLGVGETATETFTYTVNDGISDSEPATVTITINGVNDDPIAAEDNLQTSPQRPLTFDPLTNDTDPDGDDLTLDSIDSQPSNGQLVQNPDGTLTYIPNPNFTGTDSFTYTISDGNGGTSTATVNIEVNPDNDGDGILDLEDLDDDNDGIPDSEEGDGDTDGDGIPNVFDLDSDNDGISDLNESGLSPEKIAELDTDGDGVIDTPVGDNGLADDIETTPESGELDLNGDGIADKSVDTDSDGVPNFLDLDSDNDGILDVTEVGNPDTDGNGIVDGEDSDGNGLIDTVDPNSGNPLTTPPDSDNDGVPDYQDLDSDNDGIHDIIEGGLDDPDNDGIVSGLDSDGDGVTDSIDNNDGFGNINQPSPLDSDRDNIPDYLDLDSDDDGINDIEEVGLTDPDGDGRLDPNDVDGDGIADAVDQNNDGFGDNTSVDLPDSDGDGIPDFRDVNNPPIATDDNANVATNASVTIAALDNDTDEDNDILSIDSFDSTSTNGGTITLDGNNFIYTPADGFVGEDTFTYTLTDGNGGFSTATITITVENTVPVDSNNIPVANNDADTTPVNTAVTINALENDTDEDNDPLSIDSFDSTSVNGGNITLDGNNFIYTPADGFVGEDTFTYTISDGNGGFSTATITITVENGIPVIEDDPQPPEDNEVVIDNNNDPVATNDNINVPVNTPITVDVLENDSDPDGDRITIDEFDSTSTNDGTVSLDQGQLIYTPPAEFSGIDTFTYTITDDNGGSDTAIVTVNIDNPTTPEDKSCECPDVPSINPISLPTEPPIEALMFPEIGNSNNATILGSNNNDNLTATNEDDFVDLLAGDDEVVLLDGNDTLLAGDGNDLAYAGSGNDLLFGNNGNDFLKGDRGNDTIVGSPSGDQPIGNIEEQDHLFGDEGDDWLGGNLGNDTLHGGIGRDRIHGGKDNDHLLGEQGNDTLWGEQGNDVILGGTSNVTVEDVNGRDLLFGGDGNDTLYGNQNLDTLVAGNGEDHLHGGRGNDLMYGNTGDDIFFGEFGNDTMIGGPSGDEPLGEIGDRDIMFGDAGNDVIVGNLGRDSLYAGKGRDRLHGGKDNDWLLGELGDDTLNGEQGDDTILGGTSNDPNDPTRDVDGQDLLFGEAGNDFMDGNEGNDTLVAGDGNDTAYGGKDNDLVFGNSGNDILSGDIGNDTLCGGEGDDTLRGDQIDDGNSPAVGSNGQQDMLFGGRGNDLLLGDEGQDTLCGDLGNDTLHGGKDNDLIKGCFGNNLLLGEMGDDTLIGGEGNDTLTGGDGIDTFVINPNRGNNLITDFQIGQDRLMLEDISFNQLQITQMGNSTEISFNNQLLATLDQVNSIDIDLNQFI